jgi:hypothetical protein
MFQQILCCASLSGQPLEHFAHKVEKLLFFITLKSSNGVRKLKILGDKVFANEIT